MTDENQTVSTHRLFHLLAAADWVAVQGREFHEPPSLDREGFVHLSTAEQVAGTAELFFADVVDLVILTVAIDRDDPRLRWTPGIGPRETERFPHFHAPLPVSFITDASRFRAHEWRLGHES